VSKPLLILVTALACSGCATVLNERTQPVRIDTLTESGTPVSGASCTLTNDVEKVTMPSGGTVDVARSRKNLFIECTHPGQTPAKGQLLARVNGGMWLNALAGGGVGLAADSQQGNGYSYPRWVQVVFGQNLYFDRKDQVDGSPQLGRVIPRAAVK
jgi:hypothetical protein